MAFVSIYLVYTGDCEELATEKPKTPKPQYPQLNECEAHLKATYVNCGFSAVS